MTRWRLAFVHSRYVSYLHLTTGLNDWLAPLLRLLDVDSFDFIQTPASTPLQSNCSVPRAQPMRLKFSQQYNSDIYSGVEVRMIAEDGEENG